MFDLTIVREKCPQVTDYTSQLILAGLHAINEKLEIIMSNQDTVNDLATRLTTALSTLESQPDEKVDYSPLETAVTSIETFVQSVVAANTPPADGSAPTDPTATTPTA